MRKEEILILEPEDKLPGSLGYDQNGWGKWKREIRTEILKDSFVIYIDPKLDQNFKLLKSRY
jgi:hypothetical protein